MAKKGQRRAQQVRTTAVRKDRRKSPAPCATGRENGGKHRGLVNLGNTCFLNSILQCLNVSAPFSDDLISLSQDGLGTLGTSLCTVFHGIRGEEGGSGAFSPKALLAQLTARFPWYKGGAQQDAHELLRMLLGSVADEPTTAERKAAKAEKAPAKPPCAPAGLCERTVWDSFRGQLCTGTLCWGCQGLSLRLDPFLDLSLELPSAAAPSGPMGISAAASAPSRSAPSRLVAAAPAWVPVAVASADGEAEDGGDEGDGFIQHETKTQRRKQRVERRAAELAEAQQAARQLVEGAVGRALPQLPALESGRAWARHLAQRVLLRHLGQPADAEVPSAGEGGAADDARPPEAGSEEEGATQEPAVAEFEFEVELRRESHKKGARWGFLWSEEAREEGALVISGVGEESILDKWNLKRRSMGQEERVVCPGDRVVSVNGETDMKDMRKIFKAEDELSLRFARKGVAVARPAATSEEEAPAGKPKRGRATAAAAAEKAESSADAKAEREARRAAFAEAAGSCERALPEDLREFFGNSASSTSKVSNGACGQLGACLQRLAAVEALEEDDFKPAYHCVHCSGTEDGRKLTFASRRTWLWPPLPPVLTVQLKRFTRAGSKFNKSSEVVRLPAQLDLSDFFIDEDVHGRLLPFVPAALRKEAGARCPPVPPAPSAMRYELYGICEHQGSSMSSGHYIAYVNSGPSLEKEEWYGVSDARVWKCPREEALKAEAYVAFYRQEGVQASAAAPKEGDVEVDSGEDEEGDEANEDTGPELICAGPQHPLFKVAEVMSVKVVKGKKKGLFRVELDIGEGDAISVVTSFKKVNVGAKIVFAPEGSEPADRAAEEAKPAGETSCGALCGPKDLGWKTMASEYVVLDDRSKVGTPAPAEENDPMVEKRSAAE